MGCFCNWGNYGVAAVIRDLGGLEGEVKDAGECRGLYGLWVLRAMGKSPTGPAPLLGLRASSAL